MRVIKRPIAILLAFVLSVMVSGPAFSAMSCAHHMGPAKAGTGPSAPQGQAASKSSMDVSTPCAHENVDRVECCLQANCSFDPTVIAQTRLDDLKQITLVASWSPRQDFFQEPSCPLQMFNRYKMKQGPPLLMASAYKAYLARTTCQLT